LSVPDVDLSAITVSVPGASTPSVRADVREALAGLGYGPDEIREALADLPEEGDPAIVLKHALRRAYVRR